MEGQHHVTMPVDKNGKREDQRLGDQRERSTSLASNVTEENEPDTPNPRDAGFNGGSVDVPQFHAPQSEGDSLRNVVLENTPMPSGNRTPSPCFSPITWSSQSASRASSPERFDSQPYPPWKATLSPEIDYHNRGPMSPIRSPSAGLNIQEQGAYCHRKSSASAKDLYEKAWAKETSGQLARYPVKAQVLRDKLETLQKKISKASSSAYQIPSKPKEKEKICSPLNPKVSKFCTQDELLHVEESQPRVQIEEDGSTLAQTLSRSRAYTSHRTIRNPTSLTRTQPPTGKFVRGRDIDNPISSSQWQRAMEGWDEALKQKLRVKKNSDQKQMNEAASSSKGVPDLMSKGDEVETEENQRVCDSKSSDRLNAANENAPSGQQSPSPGRGSLEVHATLTGEQQYSVEYSSPEKKLLSTDVLEDAGYGVGGVPVNKNPQTSETSMPSHYASENPVTSVIPDANETFVLVSIHESFAVMQYDHSWNATGMYVVMRKSHYLRSPSIEIQAVEVQQSAGLVVGEASTAFLQSQERRHTVMIVPCQISEALDVLAPQNLESSSMNEKRQSTASALEPIAGPSSWMAQQASIPAPEEDLIEGPSSLFPEQASIPAPEEEPIAGPSSWMAQQASKPALEEDLIAGPPSLSPEQASIPAPEEEPIAGPSSWMAQQASKPAPISTAGKGSYRREAQENAYRSQRYRAGERSCECGGCPQHRNPRYPLPVTSCGVEDECCKDCPFCWHHCPGRGPTPDFSPDQHDYESDASNQPDNDREKEKNTKSNRPKREKARFTGKNPMKKKRSTPAAEAGEAGLAPRRVSNVIPVSETSSECASSPRRKTKHHQAGFGPVHGRVYDPRHGPRKRKTKDQGRIPMKGKQSAAAEAGEAGRAPRRVSNVISVSETSSECASPPRRRTKHHQAGFGPVHERVYDPRHGPRKRKTKDQGRIPMKGKQSAAAEAGEAGRAPRRVSNVISVSETSSECASSPRRKTKHHQAGFGPVHGRVYDPRHGPRKRKTKDQGRIPMKGKQSAAAEAGEAGRAPRRVSNVISVSETSSDCASPPRRRTKHHQAGFGPVHERVYDPRHGPRKRKTKDQGRIPMKGKQSAAAEAGEAGRAPRRVSNVISVSETSSECASPPRRRTKHHQAGFGPVHERVYDPRHGPTARFPAGYQEHHQGHIYPPNMPPYFQYGPPSGYWAYPGMVPPSPYILPQEIPMYGVQTYNYMTSPYSHTFYSTHVEPVYEHIIYYTDTDSG